jgi:AcrR family transcriptional regulator
LNCIKNQAVATRTSPVPTKRDERNERRRDQTRAEILDAARGIILRDGLVAFSLAAVADELGLTKPALYYYFDSSEALVFALLLREWRAHAAAVQAAVEQTESGADAVEQLMRTTFERYRRQLGMFMLSFKLTPSAGLESLIGAKQLELIHPLNDMLYGGAERRLRKDQRSGSFPKAWNPRRFAFTSHMAVHGILNMKAMTESFGDPLVHDDDELIDDICRTFRTAALSGGT